VLSNIGHSAKYIGVLSANYLLPFLDISHREYFAWSAFSINWVKMVNINIKSEEVSKMIKIISGSLLAVDLFKQAKTGPKCLVRLSL
jgi:hypothetical protein